MTTEQTPEDHQDDEHAALFESEAGPTPTRTTMALDPFDPYDRRSWRGVVANLRTIEMLEITELRGLGSLTPLSIPQGSYTTGVSASGGTHSGGGALPRFTESTQHRLVGARVGDRSASRREFSSRGSCGVCC